MSPNLSLKREIKGLLQRYGVYPSKRFGQNFLVDGSVIKNFLKIADLQPEDVVLEIGPGIGNLTREIAKKAKRVIAVEKDLKMCEILKETLKNFNNVEVVIGDVLKIPDTKYKIPQSNPFGMLRGRQDTRYKIVANLPFYLTAPVIRKFLEPAEVRPLSMTLIVQKEVAQRICARPPNMTRSTGSGLRLRGSGSRRSSRVGRGMNLLAVFVQFYAKPEIAGYVSKKSFWPQPKVDSAILRIAPLINADRKLINADLFFRIVRAGFSQPRKQLVNNLTKNLKLNTRSTAKGGEEDLSSLTREKVVIWLEKNKIQPTQRAETLTVKDWISLSRKL